MSADMTPQDHEDLAKMHGLPEPLPDQVPAAWLRSMLEGTREGMERDGVELRRWVDHVIQELGLQRLRDPEWMDRFTSLMWRGSFSLEVAILLADMGQSA